MAKKAAAPKAGKKSGCDKLPNPAMVANCKKRVAAGAK
jgi:hypothetical protein